MKTTRVMKTAPPHQLFDCTAIFQHNRTQRKTSSHLRQEPKQKFSHGMFFHHLWQLHDSMISVFLLPMKLVRGHFKSNWRGIFSLMGNFSPYAFGFIVKILISLLHVMLYTILLLRKCWLVYYMLCYTPYFLFWIKHLFFGAVQDKLIQ